MPKGDFIPRPDDAFDTWFGAYMTYAVANAAALGQPGQFSDPVTVAVSA